MAMAAYIIGMQMIASLASQKRVVEQGFLEFFQGDELHGSYLPDSSFLADLAASARRTRLGEFIR
jgi:hypothetical protein